MCLNGESCKFPQECHVHGERPCAAGGQTRNEAYHALFDTGIVFVCRNQLIFNLFIDHLISSPLMVPMIDAQTFMFAGDVPERIDPFMGQRYIAKRRACSNLARFPMRH